MNDHLLINRFLKLVTKYELKCGLVDIHNFPAKMEKSIKKVIWEQVFPEDAEIRIQKAFEMLLGDEFRLTNVDDYMSIRQFDIRNIKS